jgi:hypothetical protein
LPATCEFHSSCFCEFAIDANNYDSTPSAQFAARLLSASM